MATLVIVPGSFTPAALYTPWLEVLKKQGLDAVVVSTPAVTAREGKGPSMTDDADEIARVVEGLLDSGKEVVVLGHSYGGVPVTQSLKRISTKARKAAGKTGGVNKVVYMTAILLQPGQSTFDALGGEAQPVPGFTIQPGSEYMYLEYEIIGNNTFSDIPEDQRLPTAQAMTQQSLNSFREPLTYDGYGDVEIHFLYTLLDQVLPPVLQTMMIEGVRKSGREVTVHEINAGHAPNVSQPELSAKLVKEIVNGTAS